ncbi:hypothetical protein F975_01665 [Acinetobacter sp. ANC 3789]|uniref:type IV toxin-antitoxin system AbiEi family antitoxin domain-containing protein n=1 Tax=Acinetobacter sp. ANC 3789 TaxID=1217714 RepID=UPI0002CFDA55|nr:type IV toxin-antitoxin system AbiEi family antitoxin domain-containing protein [Acinetobacter sp. ANC 3789]ENU80611.1 hypothetical protein F975_01665 [Acinetobacter sp. ANC 3789]
MSTKSNAELLLEAIEDLHNQEQIVTRETLSQLTGLKLSIIDDRLSYLVDSGYIIRVQRGVFVPAPKHRPSRLMSKTVLPDGTVKIDIGDNDVLTLTPREARALGNLMVAEAMQYSNIEMGHHMAILQSEVTNQVRKLNRQVSDFLDVGKQGELLSE